MRGPRNGSWVTKRRGRGESEVLALARERFTPYPDDQEDGHANTFRVAKVDADHRLVFGWANQIATPEGIPIVDKQGDIIEPDDLEDAAYTFALQYRDNGVMHVGESTGRLVESMVVTPEKLAKMGLPGDALPSGWWLGFRIDDDGAWAKVKSGELSMFSIQGVGVREPADGTFAKRDSDPGDRAIAIHAALRLIDFVSRG